MLDMVPDIKLRQQNDSDPTTGQLEIKAFTTMLPACYGLFSMKSFYKRFLSTRRSDPIRFKQLVAESY